jgi:hypothetical protein
VGGDIPNSLFFIPVLKMALQVSETPGIRACHTHDSCRVPWAASALLRGHPSWLVPCIWHVFLEPKVI